MKIRPHRGSLFSAMELVREIEPTLKAVREALVTFWGDLAEPIYLSDLTVEKYGYDHRIHWETYVVLFKGSAVAFTDGPVEE